MSERFTRRRLFELGFIVVAGACAPKLPEPIPQPEPTPELPGVADMDFPLSDDMYLLRGPHHISNDNGVRSGIDLYSTDKDVKVVAAKYGKVKFAGEVIADGSINETLHSIVEIEILGDPPNDGYSLQYVHVGKIRVKVGDMVHRGEILGEQSMEVPAPYLNAEGEWIEPKSDRIHLHFGIKRYGKPIDIDGRSIAGWIIRKGERPGEGTMSKEDKYVIDNQIVVASFELSRNNLLLHPKYAKPGVRP